MRALALIAAILLAAAMPVPRPLTRSGFCSFTPPAGWRLKEDWKAEEPGLDLAAPPRLSITVRFYKEGNPQYPSLKAYLKHVESPNKQLEKVVGPEKSAALDGRRAVSVRLTMLEPIWATMRVGQKQTILMDILAGAYRGGYCALTLSAPEADYPKARAQFERFLSGFKLLKPAP